MIYYFDVDNTICKTSGDDYRNAKPYKTRIKKVNQLAQKGHKIVFWTARGALSGINWLNFTVSQLQEWGVQFHELRAKPYFDVSVDDKALSDKAFFKK